MPTPAVFDLGFQSRKELVTITRPCKGPAGNNVFLKNHYARAEASCVTMDFVF